MEMEPGDDDFDFLVLSIPAETKWQMYEAIDAKYAPQPGVNDDILIQIREACKRACDRYWGKMPYPQLFQNPQQAVLRHFTDYAAHIDGHIFNRSTGKTRKHSKEGLVTVYYEGKSYTKKVYRLIFEAFFPSPGPGYSVDHIDRDYQNHALSNLRWANAKLQAQNRTKVKNKTCGRKIVVTKNGISTIYESVTSIAAVNGPGYRSIHYQLHRYGTATWDGHIITYWVPENTGDWYPIPPEAIRGLQGYFASQFGGYIKYPDGRYSQGFMNQIQGRYSILIGGYNYQPSRLTTAAVLGVDSRQVNHLNGSKGRPADVSELEYTTSSENCQHAVDTGLHPNVKPIGMVKDGVTREFKHCMDAERQLATEGIKVNCRNISACCRGERWTHAGAMWHYL
jgi:hypothetical protein